MSKDAARHESLGETLTKTTGGRGAPAGHTRRDRPEAPSAAESGGGRHPDLRGRWGRAWRRPLGSGSAVSYARTPRAGSLALLVHTETGHAARGRSTVTSDARSGEHVVTRQDAVRAAAGGGTRHGTRGTELAPRLPTARVPGATCSPPTLCVLASPSQAGVTQPGLAASCGPRPALRAPLPEPWHCGEGGFSVSLLL